MCGHSHDCSALECSRQFHEMPLFEMIILALWVWGVGGIEKEKKSNLTFTWHNVCLHVGQYQI